MHRVVVTKKEFFTFGIKLDDECLCCGDKDSIQNTFIECQFTKIFVQHVIQYGLTKQTLVRSPQPLSKS